MPFWLCHRGATTITRGENNAQNAAEIVKLKPAEAPKPATAPAKKPKTTKPRKPIAKQDEPAGLLAIGCGVGIGAVAIAATALSLTDLSETIQALAHVARLEPRRRDRREFHSD